MKLRHIFLSAIFFGCFSVSSLAQQAGDFPSKRIHVVLPYPAGGVVDSVTRIITDKLSQMWKQTFVVETKPTASGSLAWDQVSRADPDGYLWTYMSPAVITNPRMQAGIKWNEKSFVPVGIMAWAPSVLVVNPSVPANTLPEFVSYVKNNPDKLNWVNPSIGTSMHLNSVILMQETKIKMVEIQYRGQPQGLIDLLADRVQFQVISIALVHEHIKTGKLKALAVLGKERSSLLPDVPTVTEAGYPSVNVVTWHGFIAPAGTPQPVVDKIVDGINTVVKDPAVRTALEALALQPVQPMTAAELKQLVASDVEVYSKVVEETGIKIGR